MRSGFIYLIISDDQRLGKIGYCTDDPCVRLAQMQTGNPAPLRLENYVRGTRRTEGVIHSVLHEYRLTGEWFSNPLLLTVVFNVIYEDSINDDDELIELTPAEMRKAATEGLEEALNGVK